MKEVSKGHHGLIVPKPCHKADEHDTMRPYQAVPNIGPASEGMNALERITASGRLNRGITKRNVLSVIKLVEIILVPFLLVHYLL